MVKIWGAQVRRGCARGGTGLRALRTAQFCQGQLPPNARISGSSISDNLSLRVNLCQFAMQLLCFRWTSSWTSVKNSRLGALDLTAGGRLCSAYCLQANAGRQSRLLKFEGCVSVTNFEPVQSCAVMCSHAKAKMAQEIVLAAVKQNGKASTCWTVMKPAGIVRQQVPVLFDDMFDVMFRQVWARSKTIKPIRVTRVLWNSVALNEGVGLRAWKSAKGPRGSSWFELRNAACTASTAHSRSSWQLSARMARQGSVFYCIKADEFFHGLSRTQHLLAERPWKALVFAHESLKNDKEVGELGLAISHRIWTVHSCHV